MSERIFTINTALILAFVLLWLLCPVVYSFSDQVQYLTRAYFMAEIGGWPMSHHFDHRVGLLFPHWISYRIFGVNDLSSFLPQLVFLLIILLTVLHYCDNELMELTQARNHHIITDNGAVYLSYSRR